MCDLQVTIIDRLGASMCNRTKVTTFVVIVTIASPEINT